MFLTREGGEREAEEGKCDTATDRSTPYRFTHRFVISHTPSDASYRCRHGEQDVGNGGNSKTSLFIQQPYGYSYSHRYSPMAD